MKHTPLHVRSAGILLHITSLPSPYGIGDLGEEARKFARFLHQTQQRWWQMLPLNPIGGGTSPSPYSSTSSMAGNHLLVSPELLLKEGLLDKTILLAHQLPIKNKVDYVKAVKAKEALFDIAYQRFLTKKKASFHWEFDSFCEVEKEWLDDYSLYATLKSMHEEASWQQWPAPYKWREPAALEAFSAEHADKIQQVKWLQFLFHKQWRQLKTYCNRLGVQLFGDIPFYVGEDSVDVWTHLELFNVDKDGTPLKVAGVPPDYFSSTGQKWGMPVFNWEECKKQHFSWWKKRLRKQTELFDVVRLDHFRAFASYYEIPASEPTAQNGIWQTGIGEEFFHALHKELGQNPFVAEDLGEINSEVEELRNLFHLPGMKILQFGFGDDPSNCSHLPFYHEPNFIVYTGTHDNNTTLGWYRTEASKSTRQRLIDYLGYQINQKNVAEAMIRIAYASVGNIAIVPLQDILNLDEKACMNKPGSTDGNWQWRYLSKQLNTAVVKRLKGWTLAYGRSPIKSN